MKRLKLIAWDKVADVAVTPERAPTNSEWARFPSGVKKTWYESSPPSADEIKTINEKLWRDGELVRTDTFAVLPDYPDAPGLMTYRQALREYPDAPGFPNGVRPAL